jgi:hypothetical protein
LTRIYIPHVSVPHVFLCFFHISRLQALQRSPNPADRLKTAFDVVTDLYNQGGLRMFWQVGGCHMFVENGTHATCTCIYLCTHLYTYTHTNAYTRTRSRCKHTPTTHTQQTQDAQIHTKTHKNTPNSHREWCLL